MSRQENIEVGQRYVGTGLNWFGTQSRAIWFVSSIRRARDGLLHAELINEKDPGRKKTVSAEALADARLYRPAASSAGFYQPAATNSAALQNGSGRAPKAIEPLLATERPEGVRPH